MTRRQRIALLCVMGLLAMVSACTSRTEGPQVWLRVRNSSGVGFEHVWQGAPQLGTGFDFGPLAPGHTSRWQALPAIPAHYRKTAIQLAGGRQWIGVIDDAVPHGQSHLAPGRYTYDLDLHRGQLRLQILREQSTP